MAFRKQGEDRFIPLEGDLAAGDELIFKVSMTATAFLALVKQVGNHSPEIIFQNVRIPPGQNRLIERGSDIFVYRLENIEQNQTLCVVHATSSEALYARLEKLQSLSSFGKNECVDLF
jgi:hypothetical protein